MAARAHKHMHDDLSDLELPEGVEFVSREEWMEMLEREARLRLGMSGSQFIAAYRAGEFSDDDDRHIAISFLAMMTPAAE